MWLVTACMLWAGHVILWSKSHSASSFSLSLTISLYRMVLLGRLLCGSGSCRPINRRYIADAYSTADRTAASAHFVAVGCFGMALGPFMGSVLHRFSATSTSPYWQVENAPGWFMAVVWSVYVVFHLLFFVDPPKEDLASDMKKLKQIRVAKRSHCFPIKWKSKRLRNWKRLKIATLFGRMILLWLTFYSKGGLLPRIHIDY